MEKDEKNIVNPVVDTVDNNVIVDDNTELDSSDYTPELPNLGVLSDAPVEDAPIEDPTLATTDEVIPAPVDAACELPAVDTVDTVIPEDPIALEPVDTPCDEPTCACDDPNCDGCCGTEPVNTPTVTVANLFGTLQECVTIVWRFHLKTRKHHIHVTLNEFYEKALDIVDDIIEQYQGICGVIDDPFTNCIVGDGKTEGEYLTELKAFVENNRCVLGCHSEIDSTIDEFLGLIDSTLYKLTSFCEHEVKTFEEFVYEDFNEACKYGKYGNRSCDDPDDGYDPEFDGTEEE